jgi:hypothetical protein
MMTDPIFQLARDLEAAWNDLPCFAIPGMPGVGVEGARPAEAGPADDDYAWRPTTPFGPVPLGFADRDTLEVC